MESLQIIGQKAKTAARALANLNTAEKNAALVVCAQALLDNMDNILAANQTDFDTAKEKGMKDSLLDRLSLDSIRVESMALALKDIAKLDDPVGEVLYMKELENGLRIGKKRVPIGVIGMIYESRPNVTADAFSLAFKTGNAVILKGGSDAHKSNIAIAGVIRRALLSLNLNPDFLQIIEDTSREVTLEFMKLNGYLDLLIPRGGAGLINTVVKNATVPVIETGTGNCHCFVDESADLKRAVDIVINAKTQRPGTCNSLEKLLVHKAAANEFLPAVSKALAEHNVEIRACERSIKFMPTASLADEDDWSTEYLDLIIAVKTVDSFEDAVNHIEKYSSHHSDAILTDSYKNAEEFLNRVDSAAVYVNASTRFTDGFEFGFGAEIGISTQKLHARGPMGLKELTSTKYVIYGSGQTRS